MGRGGAADQMKNLIDLQDLSCYQSWVFTVHQQSGREQIVILGLLPPSPPPPPPHHLWSRLGINKFFY